MVEWINYLEATTSSTMISLTPQNAQLRRRFPFFFYLFLFRLLLQYWCCGCYIISKEEEEDEKYRIKVDRVCGFSFDANRTCLAIQRRSAGQFIF
jgi:hypothetical protein